MTVQEKKRGIRFQYLYHGYCRERHWQDQGGADGGVTLREKRERREGRDTVAMPVYFFSGHKRVDIEKRT